MKNRGVNLTTYWKYLNAIAVLVVCFLISLVFASHTMIQTLLGVGSLSLFLFFLIREIYINGKQIKRTRLQVYLSYVLMVSGLFLFNASVHQTFISTFGQSDINQFWGEHEAAIRMNGKAYQLIWTKRSFLSTTYFYNLYERRGLFFYRVNSKVISYVVHPSRQADYGAVQTFLHHNKKQRVK
ncbi:MULTISPECIES: hypothetical protein [Lacticaseibacillus]|uniref:Uncharacterized protein n=1 Tax=Lacticaseibacillus casei TaxID=1582 RepID=A0AAN1KFI2_LACCA|nr:MULTISPECIES: hypothetical protein [Lacticaseibacillus]ARY92830.1 hypothetical protein BGL52_14090 [Lacticaseibacillus casei]KAB1970143.1 hypothetical protein F9B82_07270 [Lacticaseibacillus casei]WNX24693.1 hypothetical protein RWA15_13850 [Lacticaseibacillus casei]WNX27465.1 hypothetical protein RWA16_13850 [Lacticaseibacillus casei]